jgi:hypothetical protein
MNLVEDIKSIIFNNIDEMYKNYLKENKILLIEKENLNNIIEEFYKNNNKNIKESIRSKLKEKYKNDYPSLSVENIILDIFQDKELNLKKIIDEINFIQDKNFKSIELPIINNSLNINISILENYVIINSVNKFNIKENKEIYDEIFDYKFIYSINKKKLENYNTDKEKIDLIKNEIINKTTIPIEIYYLKNNN